MNDGKNSNSKTFTKTTTNRNQKRASSTIRTNLSKEEEAFFTKCVSSSLDCANTNSSSNVHIQESSRENTSTNGISNKQTKKQEKGLMSIIFIMIFIYIFLRLLKINIGVCIEIYEMFI